MKLTTEQIQAILDGAPEDAASTCVDYYFNKKGNPWDAESGAYLITINFCGERSSLSDLREILTLRQEVERLKADLKIVMPVIDELVQNAVEPSDIYADDLQGWLVKAGVLKVVPFDPTEHYDYTHETQDGQDWITWSDWYEKMREQGDGS